MKPFDTLALKTSSRRANAFQNTNFVRFHGKRTPLMQPFALVWRALDWISSTMGNPPGILLEPTLNLAIAYLSSAISLRREGRIALQTMDSQNARMVRWFGRCWTMSSRHCRG